MRIIIPVIEDKGLDSRICEHLGQSPFFAVCDTKTNKVQINPNKSRHGGGGCKSVDEIMKHRPDLFIAKEMGFKAKQKLQIFGIRVFGSEFSTVGKILENLVNLTELTNICNHEGNHECEF